MKITLDHAGLARVLASSKVQGLVNAAARDVASGVSEIARNGDPIPVVVEPWRPKLRRDSIPRAGAAVTMKHAAGRAIEAKRGSLASGARAAGLEVKPRKVKTR